VPELKRVEQHSHLSVRRRGCDEARIFGLMSRGWTEAKSITVKLQREFLSEPAQWRALLNSPVSPDLEATMISTAQQLFEQGKLEGRVEGRVEGRAEGRAEGRTEGETLFLERLLQAKFGPLSAADRQRIMTASPETRLSWGERVLIAVTLTDVFAETH
jgi:hypothetical protein